MLIYWLMFFSPAMMALFMGRKTRIKSTPLLLLGSFFILLIGFRFEVGGDWGTYLHHYTQTMNITFNEALKGKDPGHQALNWLMARWDMGVYGVNFVYGAVFMIGLIKLCREQVYPWIAMTAAVPYMVIVVAMGYSRQSMALGIFMWAITYLQKGKLWTYVVLILIAALFHKTAIILLPLGMFLYEKGVLLRILMIVPIFYGAWDLLVADSQSNLIHEYIDKDMQSTGAKIRVAMNFIPALILLNYRKEWKRSFNDYSFWFWVAVGSIFAMALVGVASTAVDRIALYFIPIQLVVYGRLPYLAKDKTSPSVMKIMIVAGYLAALFVWLNFATHARYWIPYQNILLMDIF